MTKKRKKSQKRYDKIVLCARCGIPRKVTRTEVVLCTDCRYVLSEAERALWSEKKAVAA